MNRRERRAAVARDKAPASFPSADVTGMVADATLVYREGRLAEAEVICKRMLAHAPAHTASLTLLGVVDQETGRHRFAVKTFAGAIALDELDAAGHYNIACWYQVLGERTAAASHFTPAINLGLSGKGVEQFLLKNAVVIDCVRRITENDRVRRQ